MKRKLLLTLALSGVSALLTACPAQTVPVTPSYPLPPNVLTRRFNENSANISNAERDEAEADLQDWFGGDHSVDIREEVLGLGGYGKTLTVITSETFADEDDEEKQLEEKWIPHFR